MLQYLKYDESKVTGFECSIISGKSVVGFLIKGLLHVIFMVYATLFLAVAIPFLPPHYPGVYIVFGTISCGFLIRYINSVIRYIQFILPIKRRSGL